MLPKDVCIGVLLPGGPAQRAQHPGVVPRPGPLPHHVGHIDTPAVGGIGLAQPAPRDGLGPVDEILAHRRIREVEHGQDLRALPAEVALGVVGVGEGVGGPIGCVCALVGPRLRVGPPTVEPGMGVRGVVEDRIQQQTHPARAGGGAQVGQGRIPAEMRVDVLEVLDVVLVHARRGEDRVQIERADAEILEILEGLDHPRQIAAVDLGVGPVGIDGLTPGLGPDGPLPAAHLPAEQGVTQARIAIAKTLGKDLIEDLVGHPIGGPLRGVEAEEALAQGHPRRLARGVEPALMVRPQDLEAIDSGTLCWVGVGVGVGVPEGLVDLPARGIRHPRHGQQPLLVVGLDAQEDRRRGTLCLEPKLDAQAPIALVEKGADLMMDERGHGLSPGRWCGGAVARSRRRRPRDVTGPAQGPAPEAAPTNPGQRTRRQQASQRGRVRQVSLPWCTIRAWYSL